jgi:two-component system, NarL family, nitrate/nitrite response regulator NarL
LDAPRRGSTRAITVAIVAPIRLHREGLLWALDADTRVAVVGTASSVAEALGVLSEERVDAVVLDVGAAGRSSARDLINRFPTVRVVALAVDQTPSNIVEWGEAGIAGLVTADDSVADLIETIVRASRDELVCSPRAAGALLRRVHALAAGGNGDASLTRREIEIAQLIERGLRNKEIASRLGIELTTVKNHVHRILEKLNATRRADAAAHIRRVGLSLRD